MTILIIQCLLTSLTALLASIQLRRDFRRKDNKLNSEAKWMLTLIIITSIGAACLQTLSFYDNNNKQTALQISLNQLNKKNEVLLKKNDSLKASIKEIDSRTASIALDASKNALKASKQIQGSTEKLNEIITGTDKPPLFESIINFREIRAALINYEKKPIINAKGYIYDYDKISDCPISGNKKMIDDSCYISHLSTFQIQYLITNGIQQINLPEYDKSKLVKKYVIIIEVKNNNYAEEVHLRIEKFKVYSNIRIFKYQDGKYMPIKTYGSNSKDINWDKEFDLPIDIVRGYVN